MPIELKNIRQIKNEIKGFFLLFGFLTLAPFIGLFWYTGNEFWLESSVVTISTLITEEKLKLGFLGVLLHGMAIVILFNLLFLTQFHPFFFILICTISATAIIWITTQGEQLRTLGSWTFIPAIILAIERVPAKNAPLLEQSVIILPYLLTAILPILILNILQQLKAKKWSSF